MKTTNLFTPIIRSYFTPTDVICLSSLLLATLTGNDSPMSQAEAFPSYAEFSIGQTFADSAHILLPSHKQ